MIIMAFFSWWYGAGWANELERIKLKIAGVADTFSIALLIATLFSPFRQISAGKASGGLDAIVRAWIDQLVSRMIGAMVRLTMVFIGTISLILICIYGVILMAVWPLIPLAPLLALLAMLIGWTPFNG